MRELHLTLDRSERTNLLTRGALGGIWGGLVFAAAAMLFSAMLGKAFFGPVRMISSILLGTQALQPSYSLFTAVFTGVLIHLFLAAVYGEIFVSLLAAFKKDNATSQQIVLYGMLYGFALWIINFYIIAPAFFPQFGAINALWNGFIAHLIFGGVLGAYIGKCHQRPGL